jgi:AraC family transcriptional regulator
MDIKIVELGDMKFIGMEYIGENKNNEISQMWGKFNQQAASVPNRTKNCNYYGVCFMEEGEANNSFHYLSGLEVSSFAIIPEGMKGKEVKAGKYAVFTHKGTLANLKETYDNIYSKWIPEAKLSPVDGIDFELYDERFVMDSPDSEFDIYVRIR